MAISWLRWTYTNMLKLFKKTIHTGQKVVAPVATPTRLITRPITLVNLDSAKCKKVSDQLVNVFKAETPPADVINVVDKSVQVIAENYHLCKALVHTIVRINRTDKEHFSNIRFRLDDHGNVMTPTITYA